jgi:VanZ family protein
MLQLYFYGPAIAWMALIFVMSSRAGSTEHSEALVQTLIRWVSPTFGGTLTPYQAECLDYGFRKACHLTEYAILALLLLRAAAGGRNPEGRTFVTALGICILYAATDELHQSFVPLRTPSAMDVLIDAVGATLALAVFGGARGIKWADRRIGRWLAVDWTANGRSEAPSGDHNAGVRVVEECRGGAK